METQDQIVEIPENRVKFFGTTGRMLLPSPATIAGVIEQIPAKKVITTALLRQHLGQAFEVEGVCPVTTKKALQSIADTANRDVAYWRVINQDGGLISAFPAQADRLQAEGLSIQTRGKSPKVADYKEHLFQFLSS